MILTAILIIGFLLLIGALVAVSIGMERDAKANEAFYANLNAHRDARYAARMAR